MDVPAAILLDLDGTLLDTEPCHFEAHRRFLSSKGISVTEADLVGNIGKGDRTFYRELMVRQGIQGDAVAWVEAKTDTLMGIYSDDGVQLRPGVARLLDDARSKGVFCAVVTSSERRLATRALQVSGLSPRLPMRICSEDVVRHKPNPDPYLLACARLGVPPQRCLVVEDSESGVRAGVAAGCTTIGFSGLIAADRLAGAGAHRVVADLAEMLPI